MRKGSDPAPHLHVYISMSMYEVMDLFQDSLGSPNPQMLKSVMVV
jgi:hypothetical protein